MFTLIQGGDVCTPEPLGMQDVLMSQGTIVRIADIDARAIEKAGFAVDVVDASGCWVTPGLVDVHEHLLGGSGEKGFQTQTPEIFLSEVVGSGITTVVGCLGVDTTTKTLPGLLAKVKAFNAEGITAFLYSGGYNVPPVTLTGSIRSDMMLVEEVIGAGEVAIADARSTEPSVAELARLVRDAYAGGLLSGKAGVTHFHVGSGNARLCQVRSLLNDHEIAPCLLYPTHVERSEALMLEAVELSRKGVTVDVDTVERDLMQWVRFYMEHGGNPGRLTASSDAAINSPATLLEQLRACVLEGGLDLWQVLAFATVNPARVLGLKHKGRLHESADADVLLLRKESLELQAVFARGRRFVSDGRVCFSPQFLESSNRKVVAHGKRS
jgi:beta-aspartyl-dipeptidase (metallo-type)